MNYSKLKSKLAATGRSWARELAEIAGCSGNLAYQVCSGNKADRRGIIALALARIEAHEVEAVLLERRLEETDRIKNMVLEKRSARKSLNQRRDAMYAIKNGNKMHIRNSRFISS